MNHLSEEQFEDILQGRTIRSEHLAQCKQCRDRLAEKKALAERLQSAFQGVYPSEALARRIREQTTSSRNFSQTSHPRRIIRITTRWRTWAAAISTVAALFILVPILRIILTPVAVHAALVEIHEHNLSEVNDFFSETDPNQLAAYFREKLGFDPKLPQLEHGLQLRGCCVHHFKGDVVGSYVVDTPEGIISVIVVSDRPQDLGMDRQAKENDPYLFWTGHFAKCHIVSTRIDDYTYCAVGEMSNNHLKNLLSRLLQQNG